MRARPRQHSAPRETQRGKEATVLAQKRKKPFGRRKVERAQDINSIDSIITPRFGPSSKRQSERKDFWCVCYIYAYAFGEEIVREAILLDLSDNGAMFRCPSRAPFPPKLRLRAPRLGLDVKARTVWQNGFDTGVAFDV